MLNKNFIITSSRHEIIMKFLFNNVVLYCITEGRMKKKVENKRKLVFYKIYLFV